MPELPEVETVLRGVAPLATGRTVIRSGSDGSARFATGVVPTGTRITAARRRGKYLLFDLDADRELVVHLGMTGVVSTGVAVGDRARCWWELDTGTVITLADPRGFGRAIVVAVGDYQQLPTLADLGPEPLGDDFTVAGFADALARSGAPVKALLLGQRVVAGVGNIYADEALWDAEVHPDARHVGAAAATRLHAAVRKHLAAGVANGGTTLRDYRKADGSSGEHQRSLVCYGCAGDPCQRCGTVLESMRVAGRGTTYCPQCQTR